MHFFYSCAIVDESRHLFDDPCTANEDLRSSLPKGCREAKLLRKGMSHVDTVKWGRKHCDYIPVSNRRLQWGATATTRFWTDRGVNKLAGYQTLAR